MLTLWRDRPMRRGASMKLWKLCLVLVSASLSLGAAPPQSRIALVIGNSDYNLDGSSATPGVVSEEGGFVPDLATPVADAVQVRNKLTSLGFKVFFTVNADRTQTLSDLVDFGLAITESPPDGIALIYYAGHAIQVDGVNYLIPAGAKLPIDRDISRLPPRQAQALLSSRTVQLSDMLNQLRNPGVKGANIVIVDSCRSNPWERLLRGAKRGESETGLAPQDASLPNTLLAFSTASGSAALDDAGSGNSPYATELLRWLGTPGLTLTEMFNRVGLDVMEKTGQRPFLSLPPMPEICLAGCKKSGRPSARSEQGTPNLPVPKSSQVIPTVKPNENSNRPLLEANRTQDRFAARLALLNGRGDPLPVRISVNVATKIAINHYVESVAEHFIVDHGHSVTSSFTRNQLQLRIESFAVPAQPGLGVKQVLLTASLKDVRSGKIAMKNDVQMECSNSGRDDRSCPYRADVIERLLMGLAE